MRATLWFCVASLSVVHGHQDATDAEALTQQLSELSARLAELEASFSNHTVVYEEKNRDVSGALDSIWLIVCGALVMFMQAGFAMLECGCCRIKNAQNILMKNLMDVCVGTLCWWAFGWAFAYGDGIPKSTDGNGFIGTSDFFGTGFLESIETGKIRPRGWDENNVAPHLAWFFQWAFCSAASAIVSGAVAERANFFGYAIYSATMTSFIYPVVVAWTWGYGWLYSEVNDVGYMDFAGSGIVHMAGGAGALAGALIAGPRTGRWEPGNENKFGAHSLPLVVLGTFILWFGWYGFNCGSTLAMGDRLTGAKAALVAMNTTLAAASGGIAVFTFKYFELKHKYDVGATCNGILAGLVSITAGCSNVESGSAVLIGLLGGLVYCGASLTLKKLSIDDPLDAFPVHGACGIWGTLAAALFDFGEGFDVVHGWSGFDCAAGEDGSCIEGGGGKVIIANLVQVVAIFSWVFGLSAAVFFGLKKAGILVAPPDVQEAGMDTVKHSPQKAYAYDEPATQ